MPSHRTSRLNDLIRDEIARLLAHETRDPRLQEGIISITAVETAPDLSTARVFVSVLGDEAEAHAVLVRIRKAQSFFRRGLAASLNLRHTPVLDFRLDRSIAEGAKIDQLLRELVSE